MKPNRLRCPRIFDFWVAALLVAVASGPVACAPELGEDPPPAYFEFDPTANPPRVPLPNVILVNQETGMLDYGLPYDINICAQIDSMPPAMCEFLIYLEGLDGYPTQSTITVPASAEVDLSTLTPENLAVFAFGPETGLDVSWDATTMSLVIANPEGWDVGQQYVVAIRGYDDGVRTVDGTRMVAPSTYSLLKREESLINCEPDPPNPEDLVDPVVDHTCKYFVLLAEQYHATTPEAIAAVEQSLIDLETLRQGFIAAGLWDAVELLADMPKDEVAMTFAFPTHSGPVVELDPDHGKVPELVPPATLRLQAKGDIDPTTLVGGMPLNTNATVGLVNVDAFEAGDLVNALPSFGLDFVDGAIELQDASPLVPGDTYIVVLLGRDPFTAPSAPCVKDTNGNPLVPPPAVVAMRGRYPVYDAARGVSNISVFDAATAAVLEENRLVLAELFENPSFPYTREQVAYVFSFVLPGQ